MSGIEEMIASLERLEELPKRTAEIAAEKLDARVKATAAAGTSPDGKAWAPKKKGGRAMANAAAHIATRAYGHIVRMTLTGPDVFHQFSQKKGEPAREVIPGAGGAMPAVVADVLEEATAQAFDELTTGRRR